MQMKFCPYCGSEGVWDVPAGDERPRLICTRCDTIHYQNPQVIAGCLVEFEGRILLCRRAIEPCPGLWTLPAGYLETDETIEQAAVRETLEETGVSVRVSNLYSLFSVLERDHVYVIFRATTTADRIVCGEESEEVAFVSPAELPWGELAHPVIEHILERYIKERASGSFALYVGEQKSGIVCDVSASRTYDPTQFYGYRES